MITFENIKQLLNDIAKEKILTTKELNSYGLTSNDIKELTNHFQFKRYIIFNIRRKNTNRGSLPKIWI